MFSGGVAEYVYDREEREFGDLGAPLGRALRRRVDDGALPFPLLPAGECIRATALGASEYSVQLSGQHRLDLRPRRAAAPPQPAGRQARARARRARSSPAAVAEAIRRHLVALDAEHSGDDVALALSWTGLPAYGRLHAFALGVRDGLADRIADGRPIYLMLDGDVAMTLGRLLRDEIGVDRTRCSWSTACSLRDFDYIDIGRVRHPSRTVPVTIKSLLFSEDPRQQ